MHYHHLNSSRLATILAGLTLCLAAWGGSQVGPDLSVDWYTIDGGGGLDAAGGAYQLSGSIGQPDATMQPLVGGPYSMTGGFWAGAGGAPQPQCPADIAPAPSGDGLVNVSDLLALIGAWGQSGPPAIPADINNDNVVNVSDLLALIGAWGACD